MFHRLAFQALIGDGVGLEALDKMVQARGMPVGPITLADEVTNMGGVEPNKTINPSA